MRFRRLRITNNPDKYTEAKKDSEEFPHLVDLVKDEFEIFILDENTKEYFFANEFFYMVDIETFQKPEGTTNGTEMTVDEQYEKACDAAETVLNLIAEAPVLKQTRIISLQILHEKLWKLIIKLEEKTNDQNGKQT